MKNEKSNILVEQLVLTLRNRLDEIEKEKELISILLKEYENQINPN